MKGAINYFDGVTVSLLLSMKISKGQIKGTINYIDGVTVRMLVSMKISKGYSTTLVV